MTATKQTAGGNGAGEASALPTPTLAPAYGHMLELQRGFIAGIGRIQHEYATFVSDRVRKNIDTAKRMAECRDMKAALELQRNYVATAREDYLKGPLKLLAIVPDIYVKSFQQRMRNAGRGVIISQMNRPGFTRGWLV